MGMKWLDWARRLQAVAQSGLTYARDPFDIERYELVRQIAAEVFAAHSDADTGSVLHLLAGEAGHATPKVDVRGVLFRHDQVLLVRERADGLWTLPGGWADVNESPSEAVRREVQEESGYETRAVKLLAIYDRNKHAHTPHPFHSYKLFFECEPTGRRVATGMETDKVAFFGEHELPELSLARVTPDQISRFFEHHRHVAWPTDFD